MNRPPPIPARTTAHGAIALACALAMCAGAHAQHALGGANNVRRVDQGYADIDALSSSLRNMQAQQLMQQPVDFNDLFASDDGRLYRFDGGLGASFPHSLYIPTRDGESIAIPAGTVYHIGLRPEDLIRQPAAPRASMSMNAIHNRADVAAPTDAPSAQSRTRAVARPGAQVSQSSVDTSNHVLTDEDYRQRRVAELLGAPNNGAASGRR